MKTFVIEGKEYEAIHPALAVCRYLKEERGVKGWVNFTFSKGHYVNNSEGVTDTITVEKDGVITDIEVESIYS